MALAVDSHESFCLSCECGWRATVQQLEMIDQCIYHAGYFRYAAMNELHKLGFREDSYSKFHGECFLYFRDIYPTFRNKRLAQM